ncbi:hypothetical protein CQW49_17235 [Methylosinus trichosporium OB3b]|uniref:Uncharacterized protein n=1 Tax=Methylosinus trichosporium (strain ATCC 35070 / NCIMB 11131 / UNIQEM 75 / OB3b) TaxID=595536 RepID=A0A2D2D385_METT3|nr:hypothetical protein CQW49_17235 [Methylosinus trichosporium OB3b]
MHARGAGGAHRRQRDERRRRCNAIVVAEIADGERSGEGGEGKAAHDGLIGAALLQSGPDGERDRQGRSFAADEEMRDAGPEAAERRELAMRLRRRREDAGAGDEEQEPYAFAQVAIPRPAPLRARLCDQRE